MFYPSEPVHEGRASNQAGEQAGAELASMLI